MKTMRLTHEEWNAIHPDFKGEIDRQKYRMWNCELVPVTLIKRHDYPQGAKIRANGYDGVIVRQYSAGMYEVRLPGGVCCVSASEIVHYAA